VNSHAVVLDDIRMELGGRAVLDSASLRLPRGQVTGLVGANGAGKSTLMRVMLGLLRPQRGDGHVLGHPLARPDAYLPHVGALIDGPGADPALKGRANLRVLARLAGAPDSRVDELLDEVGMTGAALRRVRGYSLGMRQRLGIAGALLKDPELLLLDEPTNGLDPFATARLLHLVRERARRGHTVVISSHVLADLESVCDGFVLVEDGRVRELRRGPGGLRITPADPAQLEGVTRTAEELGLKAALHDAYVVVDAAPERAPDIMRALVAADIGIREVTEQHTGLRQAFAASVPTPQREQQ